MFCESDILFLIDSKKIDSKNNKIISKKSKKERKIDIRCTHLEVEYYTI